MQIDNEQTLKIMARHNTNSFTTYQEMGFAGQVAEMPEMCEGMGKRPGYTSQLTLLAVQKYSVWFIKL